MDSAVNTMLKCNYDWMRTQCGEAATVFWTWQERILATSSPFHCTIGQLDSRTSAM